MNRRRSIDRDGRRTRAAWLWMLGTAAMVLAAAWLVHSPSLRAQTPAPARPPAKDAAKTPAAPASKGALPSMPRSEAAGPGTIGEAPRQVADLTTRYRFVERYALTPEKAGAREIVQYRVASREVIRVVTEKGQSAPLSQEKTVQIIYTERPAELNSSGAVTDTIRHYEAFKEKPQPDVKPSAPKPLDDLTVWFHSRHGGPPVLMSLTADHPLREIDFSITGQIVFTPDLAAVLPALPSRIGDRWRVPNAAAAALLGARPGQGEGLVGTLQDVRKAPAGSDLVAVIGVTGRVALPPNGQETLLNAELLFTFGPPAPGAPVAEGTVDARGAITELRQASSSVSAVPGSNGRLRSTLTRQLILERQVSTVTASLAIPSPTPVPTEANSWLTYDDPQNHFHFRHPQDLPQDRLVAPGEDAVQLVDRSSTGFPERVFTLNLQAKTGKAQEDRDSRDPDFHVKTLKKNWSKNKEDWLLGPTGWLPESDWAPSKMKVYRVEAASKATPNRGPSKGSDRVFFYYYLVLTGQNESFVVTAMTVQDPPLPFRTLAEDILKTLRVGPSPPPG